MSKSDFAVKDHFQGAVRLVGERTAAQESLQHAAYWLRRAEALLGEGDKELAKAEAIVAARADQCAFWRANAVDGRCGSHEGEEQGWSGV